MMSIGVLVILALVVPNASAFAGTARIAAWNQGGFNKIPQSKLEKIVEGFGKLDADIVVVPRNH